MPNKKNHIGPLTRLWLFLGLFTIAWFSVVAVSDWLIDDSQPEPNTPSPTTSEPVTEHEPKQSPPIVEQNSPASELAEFALWLEQNQAKGLIGEVGWPNQESYNSQAAQWLEVAEFYDVPFTLWAAGRGWPENYPILYYSDDDNDGAVDQARPQAVQVANHFNGKDLKWGVNVAGLEFGTDEDYSSRDRGALNADYFNEPEASYRFLATQDIDLIRLPFSWERIQPQTYQPLDENYLDLIREALGHAEANGMEVILDLHNYGRFKASETEELKLGGGLETTALGDVWQRIHAAIGDRTAVYGYGIMNEPYGLGDDLNNLRQGAAVWESASQSTLNTLRSSGYQGRILVAGYNWSKAQHWTKSHPTAWIDDPQDNTVYEAHHYWDADESGRYN